MSKEFLKLSGKKFSLPEAQSEGRWAFTSRPGGWVLAERKRNDGSTERHRFQVQETKGRISALLSGKLLHAEMGSTARTSGAAGGAGESDLIAQFPGKVRKVLVAEGAAVKEGDPLLMVEAMKMEFAVKAPSDGKVLKLLVKEGQQLSPGDRFLDWEGASSG